MGTYELDDVLVRRFLENVDAGIDDPELNDMQASLRPQVPIPVPSGIGAVVVTDAPAIGKVVYIRWAHDNHTSSPWIAANDHEQPYRTEDIGKIVEVLTPGVIL